MRLSLRRSTQLLVALLVFGCTAPAFAQVFVFPRRPGQTNVRYDEFRWRHVNLFSGSNRDVETTDPGPRGGADPVGVRRRGSKPSMVPTYPLHHPGHGLTDPGSGPLASTSSESGGPEHSNDDDSSDSRIDELASRAGGLKFYFYESARDVAQRALPVVEDSYRALLGSFDFAPPKTFPFIFYNSYQEFLQTNLFPIREGVLGVTSPRDLKLTLPYFGDHRQFRRVTHHEMVHQFTIQKVRSKASRKETFRDPLEGIPLWFIEGIAEYYTNDGLDDETKMLVRDLIVHQNPRRGYFFGSFFQSGPRSYLWIYKVGQARATFLEETYGSGTLQTILERSYRLGLGRWQGRRIESFRALVRNVTGDKPKRISAKFEQWVKDRAYNSYVEAAQKRGDFPQLDKIDRRIQGLDSSPDGNILAYKAIDPQTGRNRLFLADRRDLRSETQVVVDSRPNFVSLHPLAGDNFAVHDSQVAFVARSGPRDVIYRQNYSAEAKRVKPKKSERQREEKAPNKQNKNANNNGDESAKPKASRRTPKFESDIDVGERSAYRLRKKGLITAESVVFKPDGEQIGFIGMNTDGQKDIYVLKPEGDGDFSLDQVTDDIYAERGLAWGEDGLVYTSDETGHGRYNLFAIKPGADREPTRLTSAPRDQLDPTVLPNGETYFVAYDDGRANLHLVREDGVVQKTDVPTGLFSPGPGPKGGLWALFHRSGRRVPVQLTRDTLDDFQQTDSAPDVPSGGFGNISLDNSRKYKPFALRNWRINNGFGVLGITGNGVFGQLFATASDRLRNHRLVLDFVALGSLSRSDGSLTYLNQKNRIIWGASIFQDFRFRVDDSFSEAPDFLSFERFYGARGILRYPFNRFNYLQFSAAAGGAGYELPNSASRRLQRNSPADEPDQLEDRWQAAYDDPRFQTEASVSYGFDSINYQRQTGPLSGSSLLLSVTGNMQPADQEYFGSARIDGETYLPIYDRINLFFRTGLGSSFGGRFSRQFFLSSYYTLRGIPFRDRLLLGETFGFSTLELQFPVNFLLRIPFIDLEGIAGADFGGVGDSPSGVWDRRVFDLVAGVNFGLGPIVFRLHFAKPLDIGGDVLPNNGDIVPNFSLGSRFL